MVDYYLVTPNGTPDWDAAQLLALDEEDSFFIHKIAEALRDGVLDADDLTETIQLNGSTSWIFQDHRGQGGLGSTVISEAPYFKARNPAAWAAMAITVAWSRGPKVLAGQPDGVC